MVIQENGVIIGTRKDYSSSGQLLSTKTFDDYGKLIKERQALTNEVLAITLYVTHSDQLMHATKLSFLEVLNSVMILIIAAGVGFFSFAFFLSPRLGFWRSSLL